MKIAKVGGFALLVGLLIAGWQTGSVAQGRLVIGQSNANFGVHSLRGGFVPDPKSINVTSGGGIAAGSTQAPGHCGGYVTSQPDVIVNYSNAASFLRFYFQAQGGGDTTLVINDANGNWHCNDDSHGGVNPTVDINNPPSGQYDIWVGSYEANTNIRGQLKITELQSNHP